MRQFRFTDSQRLDVARSYEAGATMAALAKQHGVKRETISKLLSRSGVLARQPRSFCQPDLQRAVQLYQDGRSTFKIAEQLGWNQATVYRHLTRLGVRMRSPNERGGS
ncbi:transposase [Lapillicoccus sp.]|uniref:transposase n=1 Tax=Lapillicoccus sp. TaxID=1909287 RepID=UPI0025D9D78D|nr:transposase [Lapillicoccus sp.]